MGGILHRKQLWFHGAISREESELRMRNYGIKDGLFLVRERTKVGMCMYMHVHVGLTWNDAFSALCIFITCSRVLVKSSSVFV